MLNYMARLLLKDHFSPAGKAQEERPTPGEDRVPVPLHCLARPRGTPARPPPHHLRQEQRRRQPGERGPGPRALQVRKADVEVEKLG